MTDAAANAKGRPFKHRLFTSPMRDLIRRRATGRLDLTIYPERAALSTALADLVVRIAKQTRLHALEKADVARELSAHFAEGVADGKTTDELIDSFGDIRKAVKLIRRAKKRNRNRFLRASKRAIIGALTIIALLYSGVLIWYVFAVGKVNPAHDYLADINAAAAAVPAQNRAWPVYRKAFLQLGPIPKDVYKCTGPADYRWPQTIVYLDAHKPELEEIRRAAAMPGLGYIAGLRYNKADLPLIYPDGSQTDTLQNEDSTGVIPTISALYPQLAYLRKAASLLRLRSLDQLESGSAVGVITDIRAIIGIARHAGEQDTLISQLVRISIHTVAVQTVAQLLAHSGESLTDENFVALDDLFNPAIAGNLCAISLKGERFILEDFEQHIYTDTGHGNGRLRMEALTRIMRNPSASDSSPFLAAPVSAVMPDRKTFHAQGEKLYAAAERDLEKPMWERDISEMQPLYRRLESPLWEQIRWSFLLMIFPAVERTFATADIAAMQRDAIRATIALFRYKRAEHRWPADLNELIPAYLDTLPIDRFDGEPLRYKLDDDGGPILYSIGSDLDDDDGVPAHDHDGWPTNAGVNRWIPPSQVAQLKAAGPTDSRSASRRLAQGDLIFWPPLPDKPIDPEPDDAEFP